MKTKLQFIALGLLLFSLLSTSSFAQLTGGSVYLIDNTVSGAANLFPTTNTFNSFTTAVAALNATAAGSITSTVTFDVIAGEVFKESPVGVTYVNPSASIVFERRGPGKNPTLSGTGGVGTTDYTFSITGGSNYAIDGINFVGDTSNTTPTTDIEAGLAFIGTTANGCSNNTVSNCYIALNRSNSNNNYGIYVSAKTKPNSNNVFTNNTITRTLNGYYFKGRNDVGNVIRQEGTGRSLITNIGSTNVNTPAIGSYYGVYLNSETDFTMIRTNINNLTFCGKSGNTGALEGVSGDISGTNTFDHDTLSGLTIVAGSSDSADIGGFYFNGLGQKTVISNSIVNNLNTTVSGGYTYAIWDPPVLFGNDTIYIHHNTISSLICAPGSGFASCGMIQNAGCYAIYNNTFTTIHAGNQNSNSLNAVCTAMYLVSPFSSLSELHDNIISDIASGNGLAAGIYLGSVNGPYPPVYNNEVSNVTSTSGGAEGIVLAGNGFTVYNNKIHNISSASSSSGHLVTGLDMSGGFGINTFQIYNNMVYDLRADNGTTTTFSSSTGGNVVGIGLPEIDSANGLAQVYYNTVYLNSTAVSSTQTSSALFVGSTSSSAGGVYDLRNNILDNNYTGGNAVAFWYDDATSNSGIASTTDHNLLYAGTPSVNKLLFYSPGVSAIQNINVYKTLMTPREQNSISADPVFVSTTGAMDVHIQSGSPASTAGEVVAGVTRDIDGNSRPSPTGTNPDMGADEIGTTCGQVIAGTLSTVSNVVCPGSSGQITLNGTVGSPIVWQSSASLSGGFSTVSGSGSTLTTPVLNQTTYFRAIVGSGSCLDTIVQPLALIVNAPLVTSFTDNITGNTVSFNSGGSTGNITYYTWDFGDGNGSTQANPYHLYSANSTYQVCLTVYDTSNCSETFCKSITLTGNCNAAAGIITALRDTICSGTTGNLALAGNSAGDSIHWQSSIDNINFTTIAGQNGTTLKTSSLTQSTYFRVVVGTGGCTATSTSIQLFVPLQLVSSFTTSISGNNVTFNSSGSSGNIVRYSWSFGDDSTSTDANPTHTFRTLNKDSSYYVCLTLFDGSNCSSTFCLYTEIADGIPYLNGNDYFAVYPSPFNDYFTINSKQGSGKIEQIEVYDVLGRLVLTKIPGNGRVSSLQIDGTTLMASGIYYVKIKTTTADYVTKVVKE